MYQRKSDVDDIPSLRLDIKKHDSLITAVFLAETVGFEPTSLKGHHDFESCPL